jgi:hypothetical protein
MTSFTDKPEDSSNSIIVWGLIFMHCRLWFLKAKVIIYRTDTLCYIRYVYDFVLINVDIVKKTLFICFSNFFQLLSHLICSQLQLLLEATFSEFSSVSVVFFTISAAVTFVIWDCMISRSLHFNKMFTFFTHAQSFCTTLCHFLLWHSLCSAFLLSSVIVTLTCLIDSQFMKSVWDCWVMIVIIQHSWSDSLLNWF